MGSLVKQSYHYGLMESTVHILTINNAEKYYLGIGFILNLRQNVNYCDLEDFHLLLNQSALLSSRKFELVYFLS